MAEVIYFKDKKIPSRIKINGKWRNNPEWMRIYRKKHRDKFNEYQKRYREKHPEIYEKIRKKYYKNHKQHILRMGVIQQRARKNVHLKSECQYCGTAEKLERHHFDYSKPLEVITLCRLCHIRLHKLIKKIFNILSYFCLDCGQMSPFQEGG